MKSKLWIILFAAFAVIILGGRMLFNQTNDSRSQNNENIQTTKIDKSDKQWCSELSDEEYQVTRKKGTERAFSGKYNNFYEDGIYKCVCCGNKLFESGTKYNSGSGWPSFWAPVDSNSIGETTDSSLNMSRVEITCNDCGAHLGHVFEDGPNPTGLRYCVNSASLKFIPKK